MRYAATAALCVALATVPACTSGASDGRSAPVAVEIVDFTYDPDGQEVAVGQQVTWTNRDDFAHTVTAGRPGEPTGTFDGRLGDPDAHQSSRTTFSTSFDAPGIYPYHCTLHPSMTGEIVVTTP